MEKDAFGIKRIPFWHGPRYVRTVQYFGEGSGSRYSRYCTCDERRYPRGMHVGHGKMFQKLLRLMLEICLDFVKLFVMTTKQSQMRLKMTYTQHDQISK